MIPELAPIFRYRLAQECQDGIGKLFLCWVVSVVSDTPVHDFPQSLNRIEMRATGRQSDQIYATVGSCEEGTNIRSPVAGSIVPDDVDFTFVGVSCFDVFAGGSNS